MKGMTRKSVASPCIGLCQLDEEAVCRGCFRSLDEVAVWAASSDDEKRVFLQRVASRRRAAGRAAGEGNA